MNKIITVILLSLTLGMSVVAQERTPAIVISEIEARLAELKAMLVVPPPPVTVRVVRPGEDLQSAINAGGAIELVEGGVYDGGFTMVTGVSIDGRGAKINGPSNAPALYVPPGVSGVVIRNLEVASASRVAILLGRNDALQTSLEQVPSGIRLENVRIPTHRGVRAIEVNSTNTDLVNVAVGDTWSPAGQDSQALAILNTPGAVRVTGGKYEGGSNCVLIGGDSMKIAGAIPTDIVFDNVELSRPLSWYTDGINRKVKNLFELKTGRRVVLRRSNLHGNWLNAQTGFAIVLTPASGGLLDDILIEDNIVYDTASFLQMTGRNDDSITPEATKNIVVRRNNITVDIAFAGGNTVTGRLLQVQQEAEDITFADNTFKGNVGSGLIVGSFGQVMNPDGTRRTALGMKSMVLTGNRLMTGKYGFFLAGGANGSNWQAFVTTFTVTGNTFGNAAALMKTNFPSNTFLTATDFNTLVSQ